MTVPHTLPTTKARVAVGREHSALPLRVRNWELVELVAESDLARTFRARPAAPRDDRPAAYALKLLRRRWQEDARAVAILCREALVGQTVRHPHLISVLAAGISRRPYFVVTPWLGGHTLAARLGSGAKLDLPVALGTIRQTAEALGALHQFGWMHGDIKPSNVFLSPEGHVTLLDLGFARRGDETGSAVDRYVTGTYNYIAPETITSTLRADIRSDIYGLGVVLYEVLSGRLPFRGRSLVELATEHRQARPPELRRLVAHVPTAVIRLVREMLAKEPLRRPQTPAELVERLTSLEISTFTERAWG